MSRNQQSKQRRKQQGQRRRPRSQNPGFEQGIGELQGFEREMRAQGMERGQPSGEKGSSSQRSSGARSAKSAQPPEREESFPQLSQLAESARRELQPRFERARGAVTRAGQSAMRKVKENPMPLALAGVGVVCAGAGITWMIMSQASTGVSSESSERSQSQEEQGTTQRLQRTVKQAAQTASSKASELAEAATSQGRRLEHTLEESVQTHPLAVGAAMLAIGTFIGLSIPRSKIEDTWIGRERDQLVGAAQRAARGAAKKVETLARQVVGPVAQA